MIAMLNGEVVLVDVIEHYIFLKVSRGVTYQVYVPVPLIEEMAKLETVRELCLYTYTVYKENDATLYGFETLEERRMFEKLLSVRGVGPSTAMTVLSDMPYDELVSSLVAEDVARFIQIKGIGKATAENIVSKLR